MIVAVDTGGTKTLVAVFNTDGEVISEQKFPTPVDIQEYISEVKTTVDELLAGAEVTCLSVALPGTIKNGHMIWAGNLGWHDTDIKALLSDHYDCPIIVENDANLAGLAETRALAETPSVCLYVTISTGIGTGIIVNGRIDPNFSMSEGGHIALSHEGSFQRWETFASGKALLHRYGTLASEISDPNVWEEIAQNIASGLLAHCPILCPQNVIIGGGVGSQFEKFGPRVVEILHDNLLPMHVPALTQALHPEEAVIYGCYYHALDKNLA